MAPKPTITLSFPRVDVALLTFEAPDRPVNVLSSRVLEELAEHLDRLAARDDLAGLLFRSVKPGCFLAGADLRELAAHIDDPPERKIQRVRHAQQCLRKISTLPCVSVAAIDGVCLGGGAELAVWCDRRLLTDSPRTKIGFPEVKLGLFPAWGGTARTPRMIGLANAVKMITQGRSIDPAEALAMGLADDLVPVDRLLSVAMDRIGQERQSGQYLRDRQRWSGPVQLPVAELELLFAAARKSLRTDAPGHNPAPQAALETMQVSAGLDLAAACQQEAAGVARLFGSPVNAALLNVFFLRSHNKKDRGVLAAGIEPREVGSVAVIGAGVMGSGIAAAAVRQQIAVTMADANRQALAEGIEKTLSEVCFDRKTKRPDADRALRYAPLLHSSAADADVAGCDVVIEAVVENPDVKRQIYRRIEPLLQPHTILATNTSTIRITQLAEVLQRPDRFCGMHFFNPVGEMQLVEVIRGPQTSPQTLATAVSFVRRLGKFVIVINDSPGFLVNRMLGRYLNEALDMVGEGAPLQLIEESAKAFGMPVGPLQLYDVVGLDTAFYAGRIMWEAFPDRIKPSPILPALIKAGRLGQKSRAGFFSYRHPHGRPQQDPDVQRIIDNYLKPRADRLEPEEVQMRLVLPMLLEATQLLQEQVVQQGRDIDLGLIYGIGFPAVKGGLLHWADTLGAAQIIERLKPLESLGPRFAPTPLLQQMAAAGQKFYR